MTRLSGLQSRERGIALIAILLLLVFMLTIVSGLFYRHQIHIQKVTRGLVGEQALLLLLSAESWAASVLREDARASAIDHGGERWARQLPVLPVEGGRISGCMIDLQGRFNLNSLGAYTNKSWSDEQEGAHFTATRTTRRVLFRRLLETAGRDSSDARIASLVDWLDPDSWLLTPDSAEDNEYLLLDPAYRPANQPLVELSELSLVQGYSAADVVALEPLVSTLPGEVTAINVNTAPAAVVAALHRGLGASGAESLAAQRPFESPDHFYDALAAVAGISREDLLADLPPASELVTVSSDYFQLLADAELGGIRVAYSAVLHRGRDRQVRVAGRTLRYVPAVVDEEGAALNINSSCNRYREEPGST